MIGTPCSGRAELSTQTEEVRGGHREVGEHLKWSSRRAKEPHAR